MQIQLGDEYDYMIKVDPLSNFDPRNPDGCRDYTEDAFENCVDEGLQDVWKPVLDCNPPWVSPQDQYTRAINATKEIVKNIYGQSVLSSMVRMESYPSREKCQRPCTVTQLNFFLDEKQCQVDQYSTLKFKFAKQVIYKTKLLGYGFSDFLIDLGSSLGLWFGLSVFGITDLGIMAYNWANTLTVSETFCK